MTTYEKIVKGATKVKVAAPKPKYIEPILMATLIEHPSERENFESIMKYLQIRLQDSAWSVVFKLLIVIHIMIREGDKDVTLKYLVRYPQVLNLNRSSVTKNSSLHSDVRFIVRYSKYLQARVKQFDATNVDYVRDERSNNSTSQMGGRLRTLSVQKGLLREAESVQKQIDALLKNYFLENEVNNDVILTAFRLLVNDLLALFQELNEGVINILEHYFEMSKVDAERALKIYKKFVEQTKYVIDYLRVAKHLEFATKLHVPTIKHAPTALTSSLEEYLDDPNFEVNRRQYLAEKGGGPGLDKISKKQSIARNEKSNNAPQRNSSLIVRQSSYNPWAAEIQRGAPQNSMQQMQQIPQENVQQVAFAGAGANAQPQVVLPVSHTDVIPQNQIGLNGQVPQVIGMPQGQNVTGLNQAYTGTGFGEYTLEQNPQINSYQSSNVQQVAPQLRSQMTAPQMIPSQTTNMQFSMPLRTGSNPFFQNGYQSGSINELPRITSPLVANHTSGNPFATYSSIGGQSSNTNSHTGSNPFLNSRFAASSHTTALTNGSNQQSQNAVAHNATGGNPFRVSQATNELFNRVTSTPTTQALQKQPTAGGLENLPTVSVFPETQRDSGKQYFYNNAQMNLQQQVTSNLQAQATLQNQSQYNPFVQYLQPQQGAAYSSYDGPSLI